MDKPIPITWQALEYHHEPKGTDWFWAVGIVAVCIAITSIIYGNILFAILIMIATAALFMYAVRLPELIEFELNNKGVVIEEKMYPYATLQSFWVEDFDNRHPHMKLLIKSQKLTMPLIVIPISGVHPEDIREFLLNYLVEEEQFEPLSQKVMEYLGF